MDIITITRHALACIYGRLSMGRKIKILILIHYGSSNIVIIRLKSFTVKISYYISIDGIVATHVSSILGLSSSKCDFAKTIFFCANSFHRLKYH